MKPLNGLRVLQFGESLASQLVGLALADLGADVVCCFAAAHDPLSAALERGKRVVGSRDPSTSLRELAQSADVTIASDGIPAEIVDLIRSTAIQLSIPAFPTKDIRFANKGTDEGTVLAAAGVLAERGPSNRLRGLGPALMPMPIASAYAAAFGTLAILAGVFGRQRSGRGDAIEVSLFSALMEGFSYNHFKFEHLPSRYRDPRSLVVDALLPLPESQIQSLIDPMYRAFQCADDTWFYIATPPHRGLVERTLRLFGLWDVLIAEGLPTDDPYLSTQDWTDQADGSIFSYPQLSNYWRDRIRFGIAKAVREHSAEHWEMQFAINELCGTKVQSSSEWLASSEAGAAGLAINLQDPLVGPIACAGPFVWTGTGVELKAREICGADHVSWKGDAWAIPAPGEQKASLSGVRVLDLCNVIAGPTMAGCLTRFGAEVIKIDSTKPEFDPSITVLLSLQSARGKASILLDISGSQGQTVFERMVADSDLITFNGTQSQMEALNLGMDHLASLNPEIVLAQVSAFGGPIPSSIARRKGVDEVLQAATGVMHRLRPKNAPPEEYAHFGTIDVATGVWGAVAAIAGLIDARTTGQGRQVGTSLAAGAAVVQMPFLWVCADEEQAFKETILDPEQSHGAQKIDGSMYVTSNGEREPLATYADLRRQLALANTTNPMSVGFVRHLDHPSDQIVELVTQCAIGCQEAPLLSPGHPSKYGANTRSVLAQFGMNQEDISELIDAGVASEGWPNHKQFLPD